MLRTLRITNFRGLRELEMTGLGRVNLLVGTNNCGKTSVLEAIHLLSSAGAWQPLWQSQLRRGELVGGGSGRQTDVAHVFHGHRLTPKCRFGVESTGDEKADRQVITVATAARDLRKDIDDEADEDDEGNALLVPPMWLELAWAGRFPAVSLPITRRGGLRDRPFVEREEHDDVSVARAPVVFVGPEGMTRDSVVSMFEGIVLTPDEQTVLGALQTIEPRIERIASIGAPHRRSPREGRGGLAMMLAGQRVPIGSMGDGVWRLLGIALALVRARGGVVLVDEIDTGLHYSVLVDLWKLVLATAQRLDVQVFATTHSRDCYEALAAVTHDDRDEISLQRIERGKSHAIGFTEAEIRQAAERGLEVR